MDELKMLDECLARLKKVKDFIHRNYGYGYSVLERLSNTTAIENLFMMYEVDEYMKKAFKYFIGLMDGTMYPHRPEACRIILNEYKQFWNIFFDYSEIIGFHLKGGYNYSLLPEFIKSIGDSYGLWDSYALTLKEVELKLNDIFELERLFVDGINYITRPVPKINFAKPAISETRLENMDLNFRDKDEFAYWAEYFTVKIEKERLDKTEDYPSEYFVSWVSKDFGDGYGYDVLSFDPVTGGERLIEVKSRRSSIPIAITPKEYKNAFKTINDPDKTYYIYEYYFDELKNNIDLKIYRFDKQMRVFIDDNGVIYHASPSIEEDKNKEKEKIKFYIERV